MSSSSLFPDCKIEGVEPTIDQLYDSSWLSRKPLEHHKGNFIEPDVSDNFLQTVLNIKNVDEKKALAKRRLKEPLSFSHSHLAGHLWRILTNDLDQAQLNSLRQEFSWSTQSSAYRLIWVHYRLNTVNVDPEIQRFFVMSIATLRWGQGWENRIGFSFPVSERGDRRGGDCFWKTLRSCTQIPLNESTLAALNDVKRAVSSKRSRQTSMLSQVVLSDWHDLYEERGIHPIQDHLHTSLVVARESSAQAAPSELSPWIEGDGTTLLTTTMPSGSMSCKPRGDDLCYSS